MEASNVNDWQNRTRTESRELVHAPSWCQQNSCLHDVVVKNDLKKLELALLHPDVNLNCEDRFGDTPLVTSLRNNCSDALIVRLIDSGCDVDRANPIVSPLHIALTRPSMKVARKMIEKGANVNAQDICKLTPLQSVIVASNLQAVDLLIQAGADVNMAEDPKMLPLIMALKWHTRSTYEIFLECPSQQHCAEKIAFTHTGELAIDLINAGADVNCICIDGDYPLMHAVQCGNTTLFKLIWSKLDGRLLLNNEVPFLLRYVCQSLLYPASEWLQCLHLVLTCPVADQLIRECTGAASRKISFVSGLLYRLRKITDSSERTETIEMCMELGAIVTIPDIDLAIGLYGFGNELQTLVYSNNFRKEDYVLKKLHPLPTFVLGLEENVSAQFVVQLFRNQIKSTFRINDVLRALKCFSMPQNIKQELINLCQLHFPRSSRVILDSVQQVPQFPSLLELSRNKSRKYIKDTYRVEKPREFHEAVCNLNIPRRVKDIILFKVPLYR